MMFAYVTSMVQGQGPPQSIAPGLDRMVGIMGGLSILLVVTLALSLLLPPPPLTKAAGD
jgi:hypothetical protein